MCRNLNASKAGYYKWRDRELSARAKRDEELLPEIYKAHWKSRKSYGSRRVNAELRAGGLRVSNKRVARLMRQQGLVGKNRRQFRAPAPPASAYAAAANILNRNFRPTAPNRVWVTDITLFSTRKGWLYLTAVIDLYSRRVVGWSMSQTIDAQLVLDALRMAVDARKPGPGLMIHTDRGSQFTGRAYASFLEAHEITHSMSRKGNCHDNAVAESFFSTIKLEIRPKHIWATPEEARSAIFQYIEACYNIRRRHSTLGYLSPVEFEQCA